MRKIKFMLAMALLVFVFSGCGGSSSGDSDESTDASTLHTTIVSNFTGDWLFNDSDNFSGKVTTASNESILLYSVKTFKLSISNISFDSTALDSEASATVFYSFSSSARYEDSGVSLGTFSLKSYTDSSTIKTQEMTLSRISDEEWLLSSTSSNVPDILITRSSSRKIAVQLSGTTTFNNSNCEYTITAGSMLKSSSTPTTDDEDSSVTTLHETVSSFITGEWSYNSSSISNISGTIETAEAHSLDNFENFKMSFTDIEFGSDSQNASGKGKVYYSLSCTMSGSDEKINIASYSSSSTSIYKEMTLTYISDTEWMFSDSNSSVSLKFVDEKMEVTLSGTVTLGNTNYDYTINCTLSKLSTTPITDTTPENTDSTDSTLHQQAKAFLEGGWVVDMDYPLSGKIQNSTTYKEFYLKNVQNTTLKMVISDVTFLSSADYSTGSATVYYYFNSPAYASTSTENSSGNFYFKSYSSGASTKTQRMTLTYSGHFNDGYVWRLRASDFDMEMTIPSFSSEIMSVEFYNGGGNVVGVTASYTYNDIECTMTKTPDTDYIEDDSDSTGSDMDIESILENTTWLFSTGETTGETEQATADLNDGSDTSLTLKLASDVNLNIGDITLTSDESGTGLTGEVSVKYSQRWTAYDEYNQMQGSEGEFAFEKDGKMKIIQVENGVWRIEDTTNSNENIIITINSSNEIKTVWTGTKDFLNKKCTYDITCLFRKQ